MYKKLACVLCLCLAQTSAFRSTYPSSSTIPRCDTYHKVARIALDQSSSPTSSSAGKYFEWKQHGWKVGGILVPGCSKGSMSSMQFKFFPHLFSIVSFRFIMSNKVLADHQSYSFPVSEWAASTIVRGKVVSVAGCLVVF